MRKLVFCALVLAISLASISCSQARDSGPVAAEDFTLSDINGNNVSLSDYKGKSNVLLFFWTTWCPFCRQELKKMNSEASTLADDGIQVLTINVGESRSKVARYLEANSIIFKALLDEDSAVASSYEIMGFPTFFLLDKNGAVIFSDNYFPENYNNIIPKD